MLWQVDPMHTQVEFAVKHFGMMTVRGRFNDVSATGSIDPENPESLALEVTIDVASVSTHNAQRDEHLRGSMFLELDKYPTITFRSTKAVPTDPDHYALTGDLTIKGVTQPVTLRVQRYGEVTHPVLGHRIAYAAEGEIKRKDFGMNFESLGDGQIIVGNEVKIAIEGELVEQPAEVALAENTSTAQA